MNAKISQMKQSFKQEKKNHIFFKSFKDSVPILFGYIPIGMAYGLLFNELGYHWFYATLTSILVFAGAAQYISIGLLASGAGIFEVFITTFFVNFRHVFYGFSFLHRYRNTNFVKKLYLILALTDETYSVLTTNKIDNQKLDDRYTFNITILNHIYWVIGCTLGTLLGANLQINTDGFDFALTALFVVLTIEQYKSVREVFPFVTALFAGILALFIYKSQMLVISLFIVFFLLIIRLKNESK